MARKGVPLGPRTTVKIGKDKKGKDLYSYMLKTTAEYFGFTAEKSIPSRAGKNGRKVYIRGSQGSGSIRVPQSRSGTAKGGGRVTKYRRIPVPNGIDIGEIITFLKKATKNKPNHFVTKDGRSYPVL